MVQAGKGDGEGGARSDTLCKLTTIEQRTIGASSLFSRSKCSLNGSACICNTRTPQPTLEDNVSLHPYLLPCLNSWEKKMHMNQWSLLGNRTRHRRRERGVRATRERKDSVEYIHKFTALREKGEGKITLTWFVLTNSQKNKNIFLVYSPSPATLTSTSCCRL